MNKRIRKKQPARDSRQAWRVADREFQQVVQAIRNRGHRRWRWLHECPPRPIAATVDEWMHTYKDGLARMGYRP